LYDTKVDSRRRKSKKDKQCNGQKTGNAMAKRQAMQWPKDRQCNGQKTDNAIAKRQEMQWPKDKNDKRANNV
jgi:hypothetical protein